MKFPLDIGYQGGGLGPIRDCFFMMFFHLFCMHPRDVFACSPPVAPQTCKLQPLHQYEVLPKAYCWNLADWGAVPEELWHEPGIALPNVHNRLTTAPNQVILFTFSESLPDKIIAKENRRESQWFESFQTSAISLVENSNRGAKMSQKPTPSTSVFLWHEADILVAFWG